LRRLGIALNAQSRWTEALPLYQDALAMHREIGDRVEECNALNAIALVLIDLNRPDEARQYFLQGLELAEITSNDFGLSMLIGNYYDVYFHRQSDLQGGLEFLEQQFQKASQSNDRTLAYRILQYKMELLGNLGLYAQALEAAEQSLALAEQRADQRDPIFILGWIGRLHALSGNPEAAQHFMQISLERIKKTDDPESFVDPLFNAAYVAWLGDDPVEWQKHLDPLRTVTAYWRKSKSEHPLAYSLDLEARLLLNLGEPQAALKCSTEVVQMVEKITQPPSLEQFFFTHSRALNANGFEKLAEDYLKRAYDFLMQVASKLSDETLHRSFISNVPYNCEIIAAWEQRNLNSVNSG
jgi:hypothetical protein